MHFGEMFCSVRVDCIGFTTRNIEVWTNPCLTDPNGNTALMYAASHGHHGSHCGVLSVFRNNIKSLQLHKRNNDGFTALHLAARNRHDSCARLLTKEGQFFPSAIDEFPDPKDLDREPTPTDINAHLQQTSHSLYTALKKKTSG
ncbi:ANK_REP_REGION domain-containing protein [Caerostris extrusa]|uniref:ANK_REP_REGION domain-containing protein n=1 Tax=Caerostris extrusa TaxID=172846 RepID=A0AAV4UPG7_CAEEX|nr:ANK_REP_REGION domain-containing protein [Caerostris extrusa]